MSRQLPFEWQDQSQPDESKEVKRFGEASTLAGKLRSLAQRGIYLGTSSWKYSGWLGQLYDPSHYQVRGKLSEKKFNDSCLREYAEVFPTVGGDFSFYQFPAANTWRKLFAQVPPTFKFGLKVPEAVTAVRYAALKRYGAQADSSNPQFMDASALRDLFLGPLESYREQVGVLIFEFGAIRTGRFREAANFVHRLDEFLRALPVDRFNFAVEVRNESYIAPESAYFDCLKAHGVGHCFNSWTLMPSVTEQLRRPESLTGKVVAARFLLKPGRVYEDAVAEFAPYREVKDPIPEARSAIRELVQRCLDEQRILFVFVNNRLEGNALETILRTLEALS